MSRSVERSRRAFLRAVGGAAIASPFVRLLEPSVVQAAGAALPLNLIVIYHPHGIAAEYWAMQSTDTEASFDLTYPQCSLQPLDDAITFGKSFKSKIIVIDHLSHMSNAGGHSSAATITTGSQISGSSPSLPQNSSIDQFLAVERNLGASTPVTSIAVGVGTDATDAGNNLSFGPGGAGLPKLIDPGLTFKTLFKSLASSGQSPAAAAAAARQNAIQKSILDFSATQITSLESKLGAAEKLKLDQHLTSIRQLEKNISAMGTASCQVPTAPDPTTFPKTQRYNGGEPYFDVITNLQLDLIAEGMACGMTRFATCYLGDLSYAGNPLMLPPDNHGSVAHAYIASTIGNDDHMQPGVPASQQLLAVLNKYYYGKLARLLQKLDSLGVLDNTLIYMTSDMGNPAVHSTLNTPTVLAGGAGGAFRMGRRLQRPFQCPSADQWCQATQPDYQATANNHLLVSIAQAFGVQVDQFGTQPDPKNSTGTLDGLT
jgi:Protein of unknown function (DUF1552)